VLTVDRADSGHRRYSELVRAGDGNEDERLALLRAHRERVHAQLDMMTAYLGALDMKISYYTDASGTTGSSPPISQASTTWFAVAPMAATLAVRARSKSSVGRNRLNSWHG
jgi:hypothetical protein